MKLRARNRRLFHSDLTELSCSEDRFLYMHVPLQYVFSMSDWSRGSRPDWWISYKSVYGFSFISFCFSLGIDHV